MTLVPYDVSNAQPPPPELAIAQDWRTGGEAGGDDPEPGSFAARVEAKLVNLAGLVKAGIPPRSYHAHSEGMFVRGKRHLIAAPKKSGKSIVCLAHWTRMALAGERVVVLDRENGADEYADRLGKIMSAWKLTAEQRGLVGENLMYVEYPTLRKDDGKELVRYFSGELKADVVVLDSQRMFLTDYRLRENDTDDYALFMSYAPDPLHRAGVTTVILDNTGHTDQSRARGASGKGDLNEVLLNLRTERPFGLAARGVVKLTVEDSRFGDRGEWRMSIGNGVFGEWESSDERRVKIECDKPELKPAVYEILRAAGKPMGWGKLLKAVRERGISIKNDRGKELLEQWSADPAEPLSHTENVGYACDA